MYRWGFVGSKGIATVVANEIFKNKEMTISAVFSRNLDHAKDFAKKYNCISYSSFERMIEDRQFDAIYIATPHRFHFHYAKICLENKIPVLCEKPLTLSLESTQKLFDIAEENNTYLAEAMWTWFNSTANVVKSWVEKNKIGTIRKMRADFSVPSIVSFKPRLLDNKLGGGSLFDLGIYPIFYAYKLFGYPDEITSSAMITNNVDLSCKVIFKYKGGLECSLTSSFIFLGKCDVKIVGDSGIIRVSGPFHASRKAKLITKNTERYLDKENIALYEREFDFVSKEIIEGKTTSNYVSKEDSINVMKITDIVKSQIKLEYPNDMD